MQKREEMHRGGGLLGRCCACAAMLAAISCINAFQAPASGSSPWPLDRDRPGMTAGNEIFGGDASVKTRAGFLSTVSDPYLLDGLVAGDLMAGLETPSRSLWIDWYHLGHSLYREDRIAAAITCRTSAWGIRLHAVPALVRRVVEGLPGESSSSLALAVSYARGRRASAGFVRSVCESDGRSGADEAVFISIRAGSHLARFDGTLSGARAGYSRFLLETALNERCTLVSGYRWESGEISSGLVIELSHLTFDLLWSQNPALGSTVSAGVGRWWQW
ncbi:MAG: hypothetical protein ABR899_07440 [Candidatus Krumholzibacteriaceae bacterium]